MTDKPHCAGRVGIARGATIAAILVAIGLSCAPAQARGGFAPLARTPVVGTLALSRQQPSAVRAGAHSEFGRYAGTRRPDGRRGRDFPAGGFGAFGAYGGVYPAYSGAPQDQPIAPAAPFFATPRFGPPLPGDPDYRAHPVVLHILPEPARTGRSVRTTRPPATPWPRVAHESF